MAAWARGSRVGIMQLRATASGPVWCRWVIRCGPGTLAPRKSTRQPSIRRSSARMRAGRPCHSPSTQARATRPRRGRVRRWVATTARTRSLTAVAACSRATDHSLAAHSSPTRPWVPPIRSTMIRCAGTPSSSRLIASSVAPCSSPSPIRWRYSSMRSGSCRDRVGADMIMMKIYPSCVRRDPSAAAGNRIGRDAMRSSGRWRRGGRAGQRPA